MVSFTWSLCFPCQCASTDAQHDFDFLGKQIHVSMRLDRGIAMVALD